MLTPPAMNTVRRPAPGFIVNTPQGPSSHVLLPASTLDRNFLKSPDCWAKNSRRSGRVASVDIENGCCCSENGDAPTVSQAMVLPNPGFNTGSMLVFAAFSFTIRAQDA